MSYVPTTQQQGQGGAQVGQAQVLPQLDFTGARIAVDSMKKAAEAARLTEQKEQERQAAFAKEFGVTMSSEYVPDIQAAWEGLTKEVMTRIKEDPREGDMLLSMLKEKKKAFDEKNSQLSKELSGIATGDYYLKEDTLESVLTPTVETTDLFEAENAVRQKLSNAIPVDKNLGKNIYDFSKRFTAELLNTEGTENLFEGGLNVVREGGFVGAQSVQKLSSEGREYVIDQIYSTPEFQKQLVGMFSYAEPEERERLAKDYIRKNIGFERVMGLSQASSGDRDRNNVGISISDGVGEVKNSFADAKRLGVASVRPKEIFMSPYLQEEIKVTADVNQDGQGESLTGKVVRLTANAIGEPVVVVEVKKPYDPSNPSSASERINIEVPYEGVKDDILQNIREQYGEKRGRVIFDTISEWEGMIGDMEKTPFPEKELESTYNQLHKIATSSESDEKKTSQIQQLLGRSDVSYVGGFSTTDLNVGGKEVKLFKFGSKAKLSGEDLEETLSTLYDADAIISGQESPTEPTNENKNYTEAEESGIKAVMESNGVTREEAIEALIEAGKISR